MQLSDDGLQLLKELEGVEADPYRDSAGLWTIGCGHCLTKDELSAGKIYCGDQVLRWKDGPLSDAQIDDLLREDLGWAEAAVEVAVRVPLSQEQFDCLVLWTFNIGANAMRESTLVKKLNAGRYTEVPDELRRWVRAGGQVLSGLVRRREREIGHWHGETTLA